MDWDDLTEDTNPLLFVTDPDPDFECPVCFEVMENATTTKCGTSPIPRALLPSHLI